MPRVAIEDTLEQIKEYLQDKGYEVTDLDQENLQVEAIIISGQDKDVMGIEEITTTAPVINAQGLTAEEVYQELVNRF